MDEKPKLLGNFEKILKFFDENSIEKLNFLFFFIFFFENLLLKIELSEITPFFYINFFGFGVGGGISPLPPPGYALVSTTPSPYINVSSCDDFYRGIGMGGTHISTKNESGKEEIYGKIQKSCQHRSQTLSYNRNFESHGFENLP